MNSLYRSNPKNLLPKKTRVGTNQKHNDTTKSIMQENFSQFRLARIFMIPKPLLRITVLI